MNYLREQTHIDDHYLYSCLAHASLFLGTLTCVIPHYVLWFQGRIYKPAVIRYYGQIKKIGYSFELLKRFCQHIILTRLSLDNDIFENIFTHAVFFQNLFKNLSATVVTLSMEAIHSFETFVLTTAT
jgi:hypothetical protein